MCPPVFPFLAAGGGVEVCSRKKARVSRNENLPCWVHWRFQKVQLKKRGYRWRKWNLLSYIIICEALKPVLLKTQGGWLNRLCNCHIIKSCRLHLHILFIINFKALHIKCNSYKKRNKSILIDSTLMFSKGLNKYIIMRIKTHYGLHY